MPGAAPAPVGQVRLRLENLTSYADLRGAIECNLVSREKRDAVVGALGPDPLRPDADPERAWRRIHRSDRALGDLLMDQKVLAGVGNVYRAEVLFRHRLDPLRPGRSLRRGRWDEVWADLVELLAEGVRTGRIDTVRPEHTPEAMGRQPRRDDHGGEVYVYRRNGQPCLVCGTHGAHHGAQGTQPLLVSAVSAAFPLAGACRCLVLGDDGSNSRPSTVPARREARGQSLVRATPGVAGPCPPAAVDPDPEEMVYTDTPALLALGAADAPADHRRLRVPRLRALQHAADPDVPGQPVAGAAHPAVVHRRGARVRLGDDRGPAADRDRRT